MKAAALVLSSPRRLAAVQRLTALGARVVARNGLIGSVPGPFARWSATRDTPVPPRESMRAWWRRTRDGRTSENPASEGKAVR